MRVLSWNVNGRVELAARRQLEAVLGCEPDVVALQEVTARSYPAWSEGLVKAGYEVVSTVALLDRPYPPPPYLSPPLPPPPTDKHIRRKYANLIAARHPLTALPGLTFADPEEERLAFPEKFLAASVRLDDLSLRVHNAHLPPGVSRGLLKVHAFEAIRRRLDEDLARRDAGEALVLCGDFNAPVAGASEGPPPGRDRAWHRQSARWHAAEASVLRHPELHDTILDGRDPQLPLPVSHFTGPRRRPQRYDHLFASAELVTVESACREDWLQARLSDHAAVLATLAPRVPGHRRAPR